MLQQNKSVRVCIRAVLDKKRAVFGDKRADKNPNRIRSHAGVYQEMRKGYCRTNPSIRADALKAFKKVFEVSESADYDLQGGLILAAVNCAYIHQTLFGDRLRPGRRPTMISIWISRPTRLRHLLKSPENFCN